MRRDAGSESATAQRSVPMELSTDARTRFQRREAMYAFARSP